MRPDKAYVEAAIDAFARLCAGGDLIAYPARIDGVDVVVLGRAVPGAKPGLYDSAPHMIIVTDELAARLDLTEARS